MSRSGFDRIFVWEKDITNIKQTSFLTLTLLVALSAARELHAAQSKAPAIAPLSEEGFEQSRRFRVAGECRFY